MWSRAATASTASRRRPFPPGCCASSHVSTPSAGSASSPTVAPSSEELIYAHHERGFALLSMRSPELSRLYLQCSPDEDLAAWPDERIWEELQARLGVAGWELTRGAILEKGVTPMRSFVCRADAVGGGCISPATPPTSCRPPAPRA